MALSYKGASQRYPKFGQVVNKWDPFLKLKLLELDILYIIGKI